MNPVTVEQAVEVLNRAHKSDPVAMHNLVNNRVLCSEKLAEDPTVQVGSLNNGFHEVGMMGIINGIFGLDENKIGFIAAECSTDGVVLGFVVYGQKPKEGRVCDKLKGRFGWWG